MKKYIILSTLIILIIISVMFVYPKKYKETLKEYSDNSETISKEEIIKEEEQNENITELNENDNMDSKNDDISIHNTNKTNMEVNSASNTNVIKKEPEKNIQQEEKKQTSEQQNKPIVNDKPTVTEEKKEDPIKQPEVVRDDIVDTNSFFYSIHKGKIEMSSQDKCLSAGEQIAFIDTVDINYYRCYEVTSTTGKVLGYYLNIFCNSDNCNRYKEQINMSNYR